jgi:hypothetical protein
MRSRQKAIHGQKGKMNKKVGLHVANRFTAPTFGFVFKRSIGKYSA